MEGTWNNKRIELPDFIVPGAAKSGTTTLYRILQQHPEVYVPSYNKETYFFAYFDRELSYEKSFMAHAITNPMDYLGIFNERKNERIMGEASIGYLYDYEDSIRNMRKFYGDNLRKVKIVIILRNPVDRAYSHYTFLIRNGFEDLTFEEAVDPETIKKRKNIRPGFDYLEYGMYYNQIKAYLDNFDQVKIYLFEDLKDLPGLGADMFSFLSLEPVDFDKSIKANPSGIPKSKYLVKLLRKNQMAKIAYRMFPKKAQGKLLNFRDQLLSRSLKKQRMNEDTRRQLTEHFKEDVLKLDSIIERDVKHWLEL